MKRTVQLSILAGVFGTLACAAEPALTIYNANFAVVRDLIQMNLPKAGANEIHYAGVAMHLEPDSVILRDPTGKRFLQVLEQNFRNDPVSQELMLSLFEGKTIDFETARTLTNGQTKLEIIEGKIVRSGYTPHYISYDEDQGYRAQQGMQPVIEVDGKLRFSLPGQPLFPALADDTILKPTLSWLIQADKPGRLDVELGYITSGIKWDADYNLVAPEVGDTLDLVGWITINNQSGKTFDRAKIKLMAGDVNKVQKRPRAYARAKMSMAMDAEAGEANVTEKAFDEYHLYTLARATTLRDHEMKQVEFVRGAGIKAKPIYVYDGAQVAAFEGWNYEMIRNNQEYGTESNRKVFVMREFKNSETNGLGMALPKGKLRFYRRDTDGQLQFTGENVIDHTAKDELIRVTLGNAFDLVGERKRSNYKMDARNHWIDESFEIKVRNHKKTAVEIRVVERLYRGDNWEVKEKSDDFTKKNSHTIEFPVQVKPDEEKVVTYTVHYTW
ncbi:MAG: hypothetical protein JWM68_5176 [Verrucomicrobiales bacterium]|nr:hypothetical protein [Verrucomicrobiales bacterium]